MNELFAALRSAAVVPVVTLDDAAHAAPVATALAAGGLGVVEITLRTPAGLAAIEAAATAPRVIVGAGSVTSAEQADRAIDAGATFVVTPGLDEGAVRAAQRRDVAVIPGVATPTELMAAARLGVDVVKLFPAAVVGGPDMIRALSAVWPDVRFVPTGGVSMQNLGDYLDLDAVLAVGGSWLTERAAVAAEDWAAITRAATAASELARRFR